MKRLFLGTVLCLFALSAHAECLFLTDEDEAWRLSGRAYVNMVEKCEEAEFDFSTQLPSGKIPFREIVVLGGEPQAVAAALRAGADPNTTDKRGSPAFVDLINFTMDKDDSVVLEILRYLGEAGADFSIPDEYGDLALSKAAGGGETETTKLLLEYGADPNGLDTYLRTPLFQTVFGRCSPYVGDILIKYGARLDPMREDQVARMFDEAAKVCSDIPGGPEYIERLDRLSQG